MVSIITGFKLHPLYFRFCWVMRIRRIYTVRYTMVALCSSISTSWSPRGIRRGRYAGRTIIYAPSTSSYTDVSLIGSFPSYQSYGEMSWQRKEYQLVFIQSVFYSLLNDVTQSDSSSEKITHVSLWKHIYHLFGNKSGTSLCIISNWRLKYFNKTKCVLNCIAKMFRGRPMMIDQGLFINKSHISLLS